MYECMNECMKHLFVIFCSLGSQIASWFPSFSVEVMHTGVENPAEGQLPESRIEAMAHQVQAMFPHMPFNIIMEDLRHTHSLEVTTDNILEGNIAVPSVWTPPEEQSEDSELLQIAHPSTMISLNTREETESSTSETEQDSTSTEASDDVEAMREQALEEAASLEERPKRDESPPPNETPPGERYRSTSPSLMEFPTQSSVRQSLLLKRKEMMLQHARRRFLDREVSNQSESSQ